MSLEQLREQKLREEAEQITAIPVEDRYSALSHRMEGEAYHGGYFNVPLISCVGNVRTSGELWQGGCKGGLSLPPDFDFVLSLYPWESYHIGPNTERVEVEMYDSLDQGFEQIDALADDVVNRLRGRQKVLVHCQAGLNRSGLLAATILKKLGYTGPEAIKLLRESRGTDEVLCNDTFRQHILDAEVAHV